MSAITLRDVKKSYGRNQVVHGVNLAVEEGELVVILGPSGCGKSTLLRMVAGLEAVTAGDIGIGGRRVNDLEPRERGCAMVFQNYALYPHMSVAQNIGYSLKIARVPRAEREARVKTVAETLGLGEFLARKPGQLSGGQRQRVAMGRAMIREPKVFLYDEPLSNLDAKLRVAMRVEIRRLHQRLGATTLFVTHDQVEAMTLADRIVVMNKGMIEQVGTPAEVYHRPQSTYVASFIGAPGMNLLKASLNRRASRLELAGGQSLPLANVGALDGQDTVEVGVRAESIALAPPGAGGLRATVQFVEELGASQLLHTELGGAPLVVAARDGMAARAGADVELAVDPASLHFFDPGSGRRIGA
ncbi:sn-glycerol-3-phosphate ABC transporter ATP-binding protein UgpC [Aestuariivirga sp.]|uniref:sn-glycerol-3-phosphate ABC transporter ATP-binding protein UgpC n=1 Tax=Aestuariivirga sp. TaxID=2650926 RepID=UPI0025BC805E|nr:sn-glycerol-3-phosphate ABC transporter ATP-binding protein UgpC [Aestuariivirga sp.]MCA3555628.1 sn-glycerol-3-phosphate ABC transporter ATP-binding protein UgpC [Aestuariivirga sp.]